MGRNGSIPEKTPATPASRAVADVFITRVAALEKRGGVIAKDNSSCLTETNPTFAVLNMLVSI